MNRTYPYIGRGIDGCLVLFSASTTGVMIQPTNTSPFGHISTLWKENCFEPLDVVLTLEYTVPPQPQWDFKDQQATRKEDTESVDVKVIIDSKPGSCVVHK